MKIPFRKHKGTEMHNLPSSYLNWLALNCDWNDQVQKEADEEWQYREHYNCHIEEE